MTYPVDPTHDCSAGTLRVPKRTGSLLQQRMRIQQIHSLGAADAQIGMVDANHSHLL
jgi:hypothetical protein